MIRHVHDRKAATPWPIRARPTARAKAGKNLRWTQRTRVSLSAPSTENLPASTAMASHGSGDWIGTASISSDWRTSRSIQEPRARFPTPWWRRTSLSKLSTVIGLEM